MRIAPRELLAAKSPRGEARLVLIDHWSQDLDIDIRALKREHPPYPLFSAGNGFSGSVRRRRKGLLLVTNAHPDTLAIKIEQTGLDST
ncbi:MAG: hypothetical protein CM1200mP36_03880 [Gammaproteobacteria bacterium]|nr:MAG: hypothetical protein CM1200mP36_03880 [Gammaproteobacteria bacterium]